MKEILPELKIDFIKRLTKDGKRQDGRGFGDFREIKIRKDVIGTAEGSARVWLGNTEVLVGVKIEVGKPFSNKPDHGMLMTSVEFKPIAHHSFDAGHPKSEAIEVSRVVDRGIRESGLIDLKKLCMEPGEKVWTIYLDVAVLDFDGNLIDASTIGALAALSGAVVPASRFGLGEDFPVPLGDMPVSVTFVKIDGNLMADPTYVEECVADARLTVTTDSSGSLRAMQKGLSGVLYYEEVTKAIEDSIKSGNRIREMVRAQ